MIFIDVRNSQADPRDHAVSISIVKHPCDGSIILLLNICPVLIKIASRTQASQKLHGRSSNDGVGCHVLESLSAIRRVLWNTQTIQHSPC